MKQFFHFSSAVIIAAIFAIAGCGQSQDSGSSTADDNSSQAMQQMSLADARGKMDAYVIIVKRKGSPAQQKRMADLQAQFKAHLQTAQQLLMQRATADAAKKRQIKDQDDDNRRQINQIVAQAKALQMQALTGG